ncbi:MAG: hypothetical protein HC898_01260 [Phycisphaerales bacterium]|nr:hypothetical protein [Phycisphaerales bacterium]
MTTSDGKTVNPHQPLIVTSIPVRPRRVRQGLLLLPPTQPMPELLLTILKSVG